MGCWPSVEGVEESNAVGDGANRNLVLISMSPSSRYSSLQSVLMTFQGLASLQPGESLPSLASVAMLPRTQRRHRRPGTAASRLQSSICPAPLPWLVQRARGRGEGGVAWGSRNPLTGRPSSAFHSVLVVSAFPVISPSVSLAGSAPLPLRTWGRGALERGAASGRLSDRAATCLSPLGGDDAP